MNQEILDDLKTWLYYKYITARDFYNDYTSTWSKGYKKVFEETLEYIDELENKEEK